MHDFLHVRAQPGLGLRKLKLAGHGGGQVRGAGGTLGFRCELGGSGLCFMCVWNESAILHHA